jgi:hypothetical protein
MKGITFDGMKILADSGAIKNIKLIASASGMIVEINGDYILQTQRKNARLFKNPSALFDLLFAIGIKQINNIDLTHWSSN